MTGNGEAAKLSGPGNPLTDRAFVRHGSWVYRGTSNVLPNCSVVKCGKGNRDFTALEGRYRQATKETIQRARIP